MGYPSEIYEIENSREMEMMWDDFMASTEPVNYTCQTCDRELNGDYEICKACEIEIAQLVERLMDVRE